LMNYEPNPILSTLTDFINTDAQPFPPKDGKARWEYGISSARLYDYYWYAHIVYTGSGSVKYHFHTRRIRKDSSEKIVMEVKL